MSTCFVSNIYPRATHFSTLINTALCKRPDSFFRVYQSVDYSLPARRGCDYSRKPIDFPHEPGCYHSVDYSTAALLSCSYNSKTIDLSEQGSISNCDFFGNTNRTNWIATVDRPKRRPATCNLRPISLPFYSRHQPVQSLPPEYYQTFRYYGADVSFFGQYDEGEAKPNKWKATGVCALFTKAFLKHGVKSTGKKAYTTPHYPPGWSKLDSPTRVHLLGSQLGGDGRYWLNIISLNRKVNCVDMNGVEQKVANVYKKPTNLSSNCSVLYNVKATYVRGNIQQVFIYIVPSLIKSMELTIRGSCTN